MAKFKPGDVVYLKTASPKMVIAAAYITANDEVTWWTCVWFTPLDWNEAKSDHFPAAALVKAKKEED